MHHATNPGLQLPLANTLPLCHYQCHITLVCPASSLFKMALRSSALLPQMGSAEFKMLVVSLKGMMVCSVLMVNFTLGVLIPLKTAW